jgi:hypothetical protein
MINRVISVLFISPIIILFAAIVFINVKINYSPQLEISETDTLNHDLIKELRGLKKALSRHADEEMQNLYPEGYLFINALYGLAWCNFLENIKSKPNIYFNEGHSEIQDAWNKINSNVGRAPFNEDLPLAYGAFYTGWNTFLLGKKLSIEDSSGRDLNEVMQFKKQCDQISLAIKDKIYPVSYVGAAWPADAITCVASLALHDKLFPEKYATQINMWIATVKLKLDHHGLIPHSIDPASNKTVETARGSSQSLMLIFLKEIDPDFAHDQFKIYQAKFVDQKLGLTGIREYPKGEYGIGDVDSGPVLLQLGSAATIVGMHTLQLYGEEKSAAEIRNTLEAFGFSTENKGSKRYLFGLLPMADAFITWGHSAMSPTSPKADFTTFHIYSLVILLILIFLLWFWFKPKKRSSENSLHIPW